MTIRICMTDYVRMYIRTYVCSFVDDVNSNEIHPPSLNLIQLNYYTYVCMYVIDGLLFYA